LNAEKVNIRGKNGWFWNILNNNQSKIAWPDPMPNPMPTTVDQGDKLIPIEVKSGQTLSRDSYKGLSKWVRLAGDDAGQPVLVYGGDRGYDRTGITVMPWSDKTGR